MSRKTAAIGPYSSSLHWGWRRTTTVEPALAELPGTSRAIRLENRP